MRHLEHPPGEASDSIDHIFEANLNNKAEVIKQVPINFGEFMVKYEMARRKQGLDAAPTTVSGIDVHPELVGVDFELYAFPAEHHRPQQSGRKQGLAWVGIKFTGGALVDWAKYLQEVVLECQDTEEALAWLRLEAVIRSKHSNETKAEEDQRVRQDEKIHDIVTVMRDAKNKPVMPVKGPRKAPRAAPKPATV